MIVRSGARCTALAAVAVELAQQLREVRRRHRGPQSDLAPITPADLMLALARPPEEVRLAKLELRELGWNIHQEGGTALMQDVFYEVLDLDGPAGSTINHVWDGIGGWLP